MSLLTLAMERYNRMELTEAPDYYGGCRTHWTVGAEVMVAVTLKKSTPTRRAEAEKTADTYILTTRRADVLKPGEIIRRASDKTLYQVISNEKHNNTPPSAALDMRQVTAREIDALPDDSGGDDNDF